MTLRKALLSWFDKHARVLPFRGTRDPYAVWVSEIMLQQTRVDTVVRYYDRFMNRFPTPQALAEASEDEVMSHWSGLGYYRRARLLHKGVKEVVAEYGGVVPQDATARRQLPGIGRYTAGAIGSIAFEQEEPLVDGNVARVFSRLYGIDTPLGRSDTEKALWARAEQLVRGPRPGTLNQALMELGATACSKANPDCAACPVSKHCIAFKEGRTAELPVVRKKTPPKPTPTVALLATTKAGHVYLQRGDKNLFGGLWNLPMADGSTHADADALLAQSPLRGRLPSAPSAQLTHVLSHRRLEVQLYQLIASGAEREDFKAFPPETLAELGVSTLTRKALRAAGL